MGRYSSVQAYADNNQNMRAVSYEQATGSSDVKKGGVKVEKIVNPYGSVAGAGSGEFHVYRHARSREMERWNEIDRREKFDRDQQDFADGQQQAEEAVLSKSEKNRRKRQRQKEAKSRKQNLQLSGVATAVVAAEGLDSNSKISRQARTASAAAASSSKQQPKGGTNKHDDQEFTYTPMSQQKEGGDKTEEDSKQPATSNKNGLAASDDIPNDGSFLEMMKKIMAANDSSKGDGDEGNMEPPQKRHAK